MFKRGDYFPMKDAPQNRTILVLHRDGRELSVKWDMRSGEAPMSFWGGGGRPKLFGFCERDSKAPFFPSDLIGWREVEEW